MQAARQLSHKVLKQNEFADWGKRARRDVEATQARVQTFAEEQFVSDPANGELSVSISKGLELIALQMCNS